MKTTVFLVLFLALVLVPDVQAAFTSTDDFDSYTTGVDLDTLNGGANWSGSWTKLSGGAMTIETNPGGGQGGKAIRSVSATVDTKYQRAFGTTTVGTIGFRMRVSITNPNDFVGIVIEDGVSGGAMYVRFGPTGNIEIYNNTGATYEAITGYSANTWYTIEIDFDDVAQDNKYRARVNGGAYTAYKDTAVPVTSIDRLTFDDSATNAHTFWADDIGLAGLIAGGSAPRRRQPIIFH